MTMIQIQDKLIARIVNHRGKKAAGLNYANAQVVARKALLAKGYTDSEASIIIRDALDIVAIWH
jgi:hypothetical protein